MGVFPGGFFACLFLTGVFPGGSLQGVFPGGPKIYRFKFCKSLHPGPGWIQDPRLQKQISWIHLGSAGPRFKDLKNLNL